MEKQIKIRLSSQIFIYGKLQGTVNLPLVILVHGLASSMDSHLITRATQILSDANFATFRLNLYDDKNDARQMRDTNLRIHALDIDTVVNYFKKKKFKKIILVGHSYGGASILLSLEQKFDSAILWDPSHNVSFTKSDIGSKKTQFLKNIQCYLLEWGITFVIGKSMVTEADNLDWDSLTKKFKVPLSIITADKGSLVASSKHYFKTAMNPRKFAKLKGASHNFNDTSDTIPELLSLTTEFIALT